MENSKTKMATLSSNSTSGYIFDKNENRISKRYLPHHVNCNIIVMTKVQKWDFPGGSVVKNLPTVQEM